jgi:hypothetical protein
MDDPMVRSRLGRATGTQPLGPLIPSKGPFFFFPRLYPLHRRSRLLAC